MVARLSGDRIYNKSPTMFPRSQTAQWAVIMVIGGGARGLWLMMMLNNCTAFLKLIYLLEHFKSWLKYLFYSLITN